MKFTKMHGLGNDYLYVYSETDPENPSALSMKLSDRHFGPGSDGMIWILPSQIADFRMRIFNADGSEAKMCGNGIRCVGKYVFEKGYTHKTLLTVETLSGIKKLKLFEENGKIVRVSVEMGKAEAGSPATLTVKGEKVTYTPVSVGNPHAVIFTEDAEKAPLEVLGPAIEHHSAFPGGVNVEFVQKIDEHTLRMRVWERGSGITMACGTGACASAAAAVNAEMFPEGSDVCVRLDGGDLLIRVSKNGEIVMTGPAETIYEGETVE